MVTNSVLRELQNMADSADERKRAKGRRGLELLRKMQDDPRLDVRVFDDIWASTCQAHGTDEQLILVAQAMDGVVVTNDYNLNRVAAIRDVRVININALANAVKTNHLPGDMIEIHIIDRGKQRGQGVAYLDDGTMVVVEDGEPYLRQTKVIKLTSVTQTVQGRLIFGRVDLAEEEPARQWTLAIARSSMPSRKARPPGAGCCRRKLGGKAVLNHSLDVFEDDPHCAELLVLADHAHARMDRRQPAGVRQRQDARPARRRLARGRAWPWRRKQAQQSCSCCTTRCGPISALTCCCAS